MVRWGRGEIAAALQDEGYPVEPSHINLHTPIKRLDNVAVEVRLADGVKTEIKVWVVRSRPAGEDEPEGESDTEATETTASTEAGEHGERGAD